MAALRHPHCGRANRPTGSFRKKLAVLALGHWYPGAGHSQDSRKSPLPLYREPVCVCSSLCPHMGPPDLAVTIPMEVLMTARIRARLVMQARDPPPLGGPRLSPREVVPGPGPRPATWTPQTGSVHSLFLQLTHLLSPFSSSLEGASLWGPMTKHVGGSSCCPGTHGEGPRHLGLDFVLGFSIAFLSVASQSKPGHP